MYVVAKVTAKFVLRTSTTPMHTRDNAHSQFSRITRYRNITLLRNLGFPLVRVQTSKWRLLRAAVFANSLTVNQGYCPAYTPSASIVYISSSTSQPTSSPLFAAQRVSNQSPFPSQICPGTFMPTTKVAPSVAWRKSRQVSIVRTVRGERKRARSVSTVQTVGFESANCAWIVTESLWPSKNTR